MLRLPPARVPPAVLAALATPEAGCDFHRTEAVLRHCEHQSTERRGGQPLTACKPLQLLRNGALGHRAFRNGQGHGV